MDDQRPRNNPTNWVRPICIPMPVIEEQATIEIIALRPRQPVPVAPRSVGTNNYYLLNSIRS